MNIHITKNVVIVLTDIIQVGGLHRGGGGRGGRPRLQYKGVPKSPLLSLFCNS